VPQGRVLSCRREPNRSDCTHQATRLGKETAGQIQAGLGVAARNRRIGITPDRLTIPIDGSGWGAVRLLANQPGLAADRAARAVGARARHAPVCGGTRP